MRCDTCTEVTYGIPTQVVRCLSNDHKPPTDTLHESCDAENTALAPRTKLADLVAPRSGFYMSQTLREMPNRKLAECSQVSSPSRIDSHGADHFLFFFIFKFVVERQEIYNISHPINQSCYSKS